MQAAEVIDILLVADSAADVRLTQEILNCIHVVGDAEGCVQVANPLGKTYLQLLAGIEVGERLIQLDHIALK